MKIKQMKTDLRHGQDSAYTLPLLSLSFSDLSGYKEKTWLVFDRLAWKLNLPLRSRSRLGVVLVDDRLGFSLGSAWARCGLGVGLAWSWKTLKIRIRKTVKDESGFAGVIWGIKGRQKVSKERMKEWKGKNERKLRTKRKEKGGGKGRVRTVGTGGRTKSVHQSAK